MGCILLTLSLSHQYIQYRQLLADDSEANHTYLLQMQMITVIICILIYLVLHLHGLCKA